MLCLPVPQAQHPDMKAHCVLALEPGLAGSGTGSMAPVTAGADTTLRPPAEQAQAPQEPQLRTQFPFGSTGQAPPK